MTHEAGAYVWFQQHEEYFNSPLNGMLVQCTVTPKDDIRQYSFVYIAGNWHSENSVRLPRTQNAGCEAMRTQSWDHRSSKFFGGRGNINTLSSCKTSLGYIQLCSKTVLNKEHNQTDSRPCQGFSFPGPLKDRIKQSRTCLHFTWKINMSYHFLINNLLWIVDKWIADLLKKV